MAKTNPAVENADTAAQGGTASAPADKPKFQFKVKKNVTLPLFKFGAEPRYFQMDGAIFIGKDVNEGAGKTKKEPPHMCRVTDLETGEQGEIIVGAVLLGILNENYPDDSFVGKKLAIKKISPEGARKYSLWNVAEIEVG